MTQSKAILFSFGVAAIVAAGLYAYANPASDIPYPAGYRKWARVKTVVVGSQSPAFKANGGIHHIYANSKAVDGYETGKFPDGAVLVFDILDVQENQGTTVEGARQRIDVMVKDAQRFAATGGWGFERFAGNSQTDRPLTEEIRGSCFTCHEQRKSHDLVFSEFSK